MGDPHPDPQDPGMAAYMILFGRSAKDLSLIGDGVQLNLRQGVTGRKIDCLDLLTSTFATASMGLSVAEL